MIPSNDNYRLISLNDVQDLTSMSRTMINRLRDEGRFPLAVKLDTHDKAKRVAFLRAEVIEWVQKRIDARVAA